VSRLPYVDPEHAPDPVKEAFEQGVPQLNIFKLLAHAETVFRPWLRFGAAVLMEMELDPVLRELAILRVAAITPGAEYEWVQHEHIARAVGATDEQIDGAKSGEGLEGDDDLVIRFTDQVVRNAAPDEATFAEMTDRFSSRGIIELLLAIGQYMMLARIMATAQIDIEPPAGSGLIGGGGGGADD
jgi:4-carboxymuconolactone decarboxylase